MEQVLLRGKPVDYPCESTGDVDFPALILSYYFLLDDLLLKQIAFSSIESPFAKCGSLYEYHECITNYILSITITYY